VPGDEVEQPAAVAVGGALAGEDARRVSRHVVVDGAADPVARTLFAEAVDKEKETAFSAMSDNRQITECL
jgi:hypothetical protein